MRWGADWLLIADNLILETLYEFGRCSPMKIVQSGKVRFTHSHINNRCKKLKYYGLLMNIGNGVYAITEEGERYLDGDLNAGTLETSNSD